MYDIRDLCRAVKMHHSVYYYHKQNKENSYKKANAELDKKILEEFEKSRKRYGSPKIKLQTILKMKQVIYHLKMLEITI